MESLNFYMHHYINYQDKIGIRNLIFLSDPHLYILVYDAHNP